jgi:very-short-patch-repair endonuclease
MTDQHERTSGRLLLHRLLDYIHEQAKEVDPRGDRLGAVKGFVRRSDELVGLPGVESDLKVAGDHIWLRIQRLEGSERDIMFLSMVVDPTNSKALSGNLFDQRFNVAASRARDRMYLVRSVKSADLSAKDLRLTLLGHVDKPMVTDETEEENLIDRCESGFERHLFTALTALGYRVVPQVKTGAYRIDMVVEGANDTRLAIECDGDEYHGPDRWQDDTKRQRVLERAGWIFWRCFASTWSLHRDDVLAELLERLGAMGIEPIGATDRVPSLVERREWAPPAFDKDSRTKLRRRSNEPSQPTGSRCDWVTDILDMMTSSSGNRRPIQHDERSY